jgi:hypothetical protein
MIEQCKNLNWSTSDILSAIALLVSICFSLLTIILNRREKPSIMPYGQKVVDDNHLVLDFNNPGDINLHQVTLLINCFNYELNEIPSLQFQDKFLFTISAKSMVNYGFYLRDWSLKNFYIRIRFKGKYLSRFPLFPSRTFEQVIWYSGIVLHATEQAASVKISTTHKDEITKLETQHKLALKQYEKAIDKKFRN